MTKSDIMLTVLVFSHFPPKIFVCRPLFPKTLHWPVSDSGSFHVVEVIAASIQCQYTYISPRALSLIVCCYRRGKHVKMEIVPD